MTGTDRLALALQTGVLALPPEGRIAVLRAAPGPCLEVIPRERLACEQSFRPLHDALAAEGHAVSTRIEGPAAMVVVNLTRNRAETLANIARGLGMLPPGGRLAVAGSKTDGVDGIARQVGRVLPLEGAFVKAHGRVFWLARPETLPDPISDWARDGRPSPNDEGFLTAPGIFSSEHPDPGSVKLAAAIDGPLKGRVADLGAGWGWLAQAVLARSPAIEALDLYEAEAAALDCARVNVPDPRAHFHWADATSLGAGAARCDAVVTNPPFHHGRAADPHLGAAFIRAAAALLKPGGRLFMVANRQLPYEAALDGAFRRWEKLGEDGRFKVLRAELPRRP